MIDVQGLKKKYGNKEALKGISFHVDRGEILGLLGPNGAGKTTTMNILTGYIEPDEGEVSIDTEDMLENPIRAKRKIGYLPELPPLYQDMTVLEYLHFVFDLKRVKESKDEHINEISKRVRIEDVLHRIIKNLSKGYKQRVGIAQVLIGNPPVIIFDEPTVGLDPQQIIEIRALIKDLKEKHTIIVSSHVLSEIQSICDRVVVIDHGNIVADGTAEDLSKELYAGNHYIAQIQGVEEKVLKVLHNVDGVLSVDKKRELEPGTYEYVLQTEAGLDVRKELFKTLAAEDLPLLGLREERASLEEIFLKITGPKDTAVSEQTQPSDTGAGHDEEINELEVVFDVDDAKYEGWKRIDSSPLEKDDRDQTTGVEQNDNESND